MRKNEWRRATALGAATAALLGCGEAATVTSCNPAAGLTPICGFTNPEDLAALPGGDWMMASEYRQDDVGGALVALRIAGARRVAAWPPPDGALPPDPAEAKPGWGDAACPGPPDREVFAPHGIDLVVPRMRPPRLLVVNHGGREAIEWFEVGTARGAPALWWRGCALLPDGVWPNDVAALPGGGLVVTNMLGAPDGLAGLIGSIELALGRDTGNALEWTPDGGWRALPGSDGSGPNGIAVDAAGRRVYVAEWGAQRLLRFQREGDPEPVTVDLPHHPDNITWASDGRLLVAGQIGPLWDLLACGTVRSGTCAVPFSVVAVDPETLATEVVIERDGTSGMGAATVALQNGEVIVLGTFAGDRVALFPFR